MKKILYKVLFSILLFFLYIIINSNSTVYAAEQPICDGTYIIKSAINENYVLDVPSNSKSNSAVIELWRKNLGDNQKFNFKHVGNGYYTISAKHSGKYMDVAGAEQNNGAEVIQYEYNGNDNQKWLVKAHGDGTYSIISKCNNKCLDIARANMSNGAEVITWQNNGGTNQMFVLEFAEEKKLPDGTYKIASAIDTTYIMDVAGVSRDNSAMVELWFDNGGDNQKFYIKNVGNGYYSIAAVHSSKMLDLPGGSKQLGTDIIQFQDNGGDNQRWLIKYVGDDCYNIISKCSGNYLDVARSSAKMGTEITTWSKNGKTNQKFKFIPTKASYQDESGRSAKFKYEHPEIKIGIDVSKFQGKIDWNAVKKDGIDYAMIRAGFRGYGSSGSLNIDPMFEENVKGARAAGLDVGVYFFSQAKNYDEGVKEAEYTIGLIKHFDITYPVAFDTEQSSSPTNTGRADNISVQARTDATKGFCSTIVNNGYETLIYASPSWLKDNLDLNQLKEYDIWLANYTGATQEDPLKRPSNYKGKYVMWQYTDSGSVNGINGNVDCDLFYYLR